MKKLLVLLVSVMCSGSADAMDRFFGRAEKPVEAEKPFKTYMVTPTDEKLLAEIRPQPVRDRLGNYSFDETGKPRMQERNEDNVRSLLAQGANPNRIAGGLTLLNHLTADQKLDLPVILALLERGAEPTGYDLMNVISNQSATSVTVFRELLAQKPELVNDPGFKAYMNTSVNQAQRAWETARKQFNAAKPAEQVILERKIAIYNSFKPSLLQRLRG